MNVSNDELLCTRGFVLSQFYHNYVVGYNKMGILKIVSRITPKVFEMDS